MIGMSKYRAKVRVARDDDLVFPRGVVDDLVVAGRTHPDLADVFSVEAVLVQHVEVEPGRLASTRKEISGMERLHVLVRDQA